MSTVTKEIMNLARKAGYEGEDKTNVTKAIDALADTLAGENLEQATNVAAAIRKLQPYVDGGGDGEDYNWENIPLTINIDLPWTEDDPEHTYEDIENYIDENILLVNLGSEALPARFPPIYYLDNEKNILGAGSVDALLIGGTIITTYDPTSAYLLRPFYDVKNNHIDKPN